MHPTQQVQQNQQQTSLSPVQIQNKSPPQNIQVKRKSPEQPQGNTNNNTNGAVNKRPVKRVKQMNDLKKSLLSNNNETNQRTQNQKKPNFVKPLGQILQEQGKDIPQNTQKEVNGSRKRKQVVPPEEGSTVSPSRTVEPLNKKSRVQPKNGSTSPSKGNVSKASEARKQVAIPPSSKKNPPKTKDFGVKKLSQILTEKGGHESTTPPDSPPATMKMPLPTAVRSVKTAPIITTPSVADQTTLDKEDAEILREFEELGVDVDVNASADSLAELDETELIDLLD
eukprot:TRINITY_DN631_c0_g1_i1.p1 TRINITY_DN631_c0_g1~~TRINITY_DN631_c0_g1_i1.p1  ORF type:complete len:282 (-),score=62.39 TRINITY_DN631_c0_g1_i1:96-941(-)